MSFKNLSFITLCILTISTPVFAKEHIVKIVSDYDAMRMVFEPRNLTIAKGDTVTWINENDEEHDMLTYPDGFPQGAKGFQSPMLRKEGEKWSHTFTDSGTYQYHCIPHVMMGMRGTITVDKPTDSVALMNKPTPEDVKKYRNMMLEFFDDDDFEDMPKYVAERLHSKKFKDKKVETVKGGKSSSQESKKQSDI